MKNKPPLECHCGGCQTPHYIGDKNCYREIVKIPPVQKSGVSNMWIVKDHPNKVVITEHTLKQQWGYSQHKDGRWSKVKQQYLDPSNSLEREK